MGKRIRSQRRGAGKSGFTAPSHRFKSKAHYRPGEARGVVSAFDKDPSKTGLIMTVRWDDGRSSAMIAPEGVTVGQTITQSKDAEVKLGNVLPLASIPEGIPFFNIELRPGDGGKAVRASGAWSFIVTKTEKEVSVRLPSKASKNLNTACKATIGVAAGGGRPELPLLKAGKAWHKARARGHHYPTVRGVAMNPVAHPHGGKEHHAGKPTTVKRGAPPGRAVGHIAPKRVGRRKRK